MALSRSPGTAGLLDTVSSEGTHPVIPGKAFSGRESNERQRERKREARGRASLYLVLPSSMARSPGLGQAGPEPGVPAALPTGAPGHAPCLPRAMSRDGDGEGGGGSARGVSTWDVVSQVAGGLAALSASPKPLLIGVVWGRGTGGHSAHPCITLHSVATGPSHSTSGPGSAAWEVR